MKRKTIWFCVVMVVAAGTSKTMYESTNRIEAEEVRDFLSTIETSLDVEYQLTKKL